MKKILLSLALLALTLFIVPAQSYAETESYGPQGKRFGLGIVAGDPTGITGKGYLGPRLALDVIAAWSFFDEGFTIIGDLTYDLFDIPVQSDKFTLPLYIGAGAKLVIDQQEPGDDKTGFVIRVPIGVAVQFTNHPIEVFFEAAPGISLAPETEFDISGGVGARFYF